MGLILQGSAAKKRFWRQLILALFLGVLFVFCVGAGVCFVSGARGVWGLGRRVDDLDGYAEITVIVGGAFTGLTLLLAWFCVKAMCKTHQDDVVLPVNDTK